MNRVPTPENPIPLGRNGKPVWENDIRRLLKDFNCSLYAKDCIGYAKAEAKKMKRQVNGEDLYNLAMHRVKHVVSESLH